METTMLVNSTKRGLRLALAAVLLGVLAGAGCGGGSTNAALKELVVKKTATDLSKPDVNAAFWNDVSVGNVPLSAQPLIAPRPEKTQTDGVKVQAVHDGTRVAFRLRWKDAEKSEAGKLGEFSDAIAMEFPLNKGELPPVMMGGKGNPVHIFHWRAQYQRDKEKGKPTVKDLYPNSSVDMYPMEFKEAKGGTKEQQEQFSPGKAEGNPQSYEKTGVDEVIAEGFSTSTVQEGHGSMAAAEWKGGEWVVVIVRPLAIEGGSSLKAGEKSAVAFAVWQGGQGEVGSRKSVAGEWIPVTIQ